MQGRTESAPRRCSPRERIRNISSRFPAPLRALVPCASAVSRRGFFALLAASLIACERHGPSIDALRAGGELRVALVSVPHTYFLEPEGVLGFDYDLLRAFCDRLGIRLKARFVSSRALAMELVEDKKVHLAAGLLPVTADPATRVRFGPSYAMLQSQVIHRGDTAPPGSIAELVGRTIETVAGGSGLVELERHARILPDLRFAAPVDASSEQLLVRLEAGSIDAAVIPSLDFAVLRSKFPTLAIAFDLGSPRATAWALSEESELSIDNAIVDFFAADELVKLRESLWYRYYGHYREFDFVDAREFLRAYDERLPPIRDLFRDTAAETGIDWRLLAALSYQESHWDPAARSPTGVRGLMMLTRRTAAALGVSRDDPAQAVAGGGRYLAKLIAALPASVAGEERLWFGLAAYNIGAGHLADARKLTQQAGRDPDTWHDVQHYLGLLSKRHVAKNTRHGLARGGETLHFVASIRRYLDTIRLLERREVALEDGDGEHGFFALEAL